MKAQETVQKGDEAFFSYRSATNSIFLRHYGFLIEANDVVQIPVNLEIEKLNSKKQQLLQQEVLKYVKPFRCNVFSESYPNNEMTIYIDRKDIFVFNDCLQCYVCLMG